MVNLDLVSRIQEAFELLPKIVEKLNKWVDLYNEVYNRAQTEGKVFVEDIHHLNDQYVGIYFIGIKSLSDLINFDHLLQDPGFSLMVKDFLNTFPVFNERKTELEFVGRTVQNLHYLHAVGMANDFEMDAPKELSQKFLKLVTPDKLNRAVEIFNQLFKIDLLYLFTPSEIDINYIIKSTIPDNYRTGWQKDVYVVFRDDLQTVPNLNLPRLPLIYILRELRNNALDEMKQGGVVSIKTFSENRHVIIQYKDTGQGIKADDLKRIFEPGYTTKQAANQPR